MSETTHLHIFQAESDSHMELPYADCGIKAGFPSPAQDYMSESIDLNRELVRHKECTFYARVEGESMRDAGIGNGDLVVIDRSLEPHDGCYVAAYIDDGFTLKQYKSDPAHNCAWLVPANPDFEPIRVTPEDEFIVWGVITHCIRTL